MPMTTISLRLEESDAALIKEYAAMKRMSVSDLIRQTLLDRIAAEVDLHSYKKAVEQYRGGWCTAGSRRTWRAARIPAGRGTATGTVGGGGTASGSTA